MIGNIEQPMPPFGPRYEPIWPIPHGLANPEAIDWSICEQHEWQDEYCGYLPGEPDEYVRHCKNCGMEAED